MRPLRLILVCVLLGAVTTVGVAWGFAMRGDPSGRQGDVAVDRALGAEHIEVWVDRYPDSLHEATIRQNAPHWVTMFRYLDDRRGWPMLAMRHRRWSADVDPRTNFIQGDFTELHRIDWAIPVSQSEEIIASGSLVDDVRLLPLMPMWTGFVVNTIVYAQAWSVIIVLPGVLTRMIRRRRGLCITCGYNIAFRPHSCCPECGNPDAAASDAWVTRRLLPHLGAGIATTVVVAFGCSVTVLPEPLLHWSEEYFVMWPGCRRDLHLDYSSISNYSEIHDTRGWPLPALGSIDQCEYEGGGMYERVGVKWGMPLTPAPQNALLWESGITIPLRPCVTGFVVDSLVFMQVWIILVCCVRRIRGT